MCVRFPFLATQDLVTVRSYSRAIDELEEQLKQPDVINDAVRFTMLNGRLSSLKVKYDNAQADAATSRSKAADLQKAFEQCPTDPALERTFLGGGGGGRGGDKGMERAFTMAADAVRDLAEFLTPR
jgi:hypothetical protein